MTRSISIVTLILFVTVSSKAFGQGRVDTDPILSRIWWVTQKIDGLSHLDKSVRKDTSAFEKGFTIFFYKSDTLCKVSKLTKNSNGTQLTSFYFDNRKPIYISVARNNFKLSDSIKDLNKAVLSFEIGQDTLTNQKPSYVELYSASYYFYQGKVRFAAVITYSDKGLLKNVRHDNKKDITEAMKLVQNAGQYLLKRK